MATPPLWVCRLFHIVVKLANSNRQLVMLVPPDREQFGDLLAAAIALLRLTRWTNSARFWASMSTGAAWPVPPVAAFPPP